MDILISANQPILDFMRNYQEEIFVDMGREEFVKWMEKLKKRNADEEEIQEITV